MAHLTSAHRQLFCRRDDEIFPDVQTLFDHCQRQKQASHDSWQMPKAIQPLAQNGRLDLQLGTDGAFLMNDWSFTQLCRLARVNKDTINRLSPETAAQALREGSNYSYSRRASRAHEKAKSAENYG